FVGQIGPGAAENVGHLGFEDRRVGVDQAMGAVVLDQIIPVVQRGAAEAGRRGSDLFQSRSDAVVIFLSEGSSPALFFFLPPPPGGGGGGGGVERFYANVDAAYLPLDPHPTLPT